MVAASFVCTGRNQPWLNIDLHALSEYEIIRVYTKPGEVLKLSELGKVARIPPRLKEFAGMKVVTRRVCAMKYCSCRVKCILHPLQTSRVILGRALK